jgi:hypothetical protein
VRIKVIKIEKIMKIFDLVTVIIEKRQKEAFLGRKEPESLTLFLD